MQSYVSLVKGLVQSGQEYWSGGGKVKDSMVKIDKATTIFDARSFNDSQIDPKKCIKTLAKLIYLFSQGQPFTTDETAQLFFSITKLFQTEDVQLKRVVYMTVKEMRNQPSIYIVTSSLLKDIHHKNNNFKRNALRTIPLVLDPSNLVQVERYIKGLIGDKQPGVASAALLSGIQLFQTNQEMVRKWGAQISDKMQSPDPYVQYHTLILLSDIKKKDTNSYKKYLMNLMKQELNGVAMVQYLRNLRQLGNDIEFDSPQAKQLIGFINKQIRNKDDCIVMEAAKLACESPLMGNKDLMEVVKILQTYLISPSTVKKYTVLKLYNNLLKNPARKAIILNVKEIEKVLNDSNTSLSSIAASLLLRICTEGYLERLFPQIQKTMQEMSTDYKIDVIRSLCNVLKTYPKKYELVNKFLMGIMKREDVEQIRCQGIKVMEYQIQQIGGQAKTDCIRELSRYLSAANYKRIHFQILGIISRQVKQQDINGEIFKNLIEEVFLQEGPVRACGLSTLIKISKFEKNKKIPLQKTIDKFRNDQDEEVRSRIKFQTIEKPLNYYELDLIQNYLTHNYQQIQNSQDHSLLDFGKMSDWGQSIGAALMKPINEQSQKQKQQLDEQQRYKQIFLNHPVFKDYGVLRKINKAILVTDSEGQLISKVRIFLFDEFLVFQFKIQNKMHDGPTLQNVRVQLKHSGESFKVQHIVPAKTILKNEFGQCYVGITKAQQCQDLFPEQKIQSIAKFTVKQYSGEVLKSTYLDEYSFEQFEIKLSSYMSSWHVMPDEFPTTWSNLKGHEEKGTFQIKYASTQAAIQELIKHFGMYVVDTIDSQNNKSNYVTVQLAGKFLGISQALVVLMVAFDTKMGCLLKIQVKSVSEQLTDQLIQSIQ